jgi:hypothetical protein
MADKEVREPEANLSLLLAACPAVGRRFRHYKGTVYRIMGAALQEATREPLVIYVRDGDAWAPVWARPLKEWVEVVALPDGSACYRFMPVS